MSLAEIAACTSVLLTNVVPRSAPFHRTTDDATKLVPVAVSVNPPEPATASFGEMELNAGAGLSIVNVCAVDVPPPGVGVKTVTDAVPAVAMSAAEIDASTCVLLTKVVERALPFQCT